MSVKKTFDVGMLLAALGDQMQEAAVLVEQPSGQAVYCNKAFVRLFGGGAENNAVTNFFEQRQIKRLTEINAQRPADLLMQDRGYPELMEFTMPAGEDDFFAQTQVKHISFDSQSYQLFLIQPIDQSLFERIAIGIVIVNKRHEIIAVNPCALKMFGFPKAELAGKMIETLIPNRIREKHVRHRRSFSGNNFYRPMGKGLELMALKKDGSEFPVEISLGNYLSALTQYTIAFIIDISERRQAENELQQLNNKLERLVEIRTGELRRTLDELEISSKLLQQGNVFQQALLDSAGALIITLDNNGLIQMANQEAAAKLGYCRSGLLGRHFSLFWGGGKINTEHYPVAYRPEPAAALPTGTVFEVLEAGCMGGESIYIRKDGTVFPVQVHLNPVEESHGKTSLIILVAMDISDLKDTTYELSRALAGEKELGAMQSKFVTIASHQFRTPLSTILSSAYLIEKYTASEDQPARYRHLQLIVGAVNLLTDILNDFLNVKKIEEGRVPVKNIAFDIYELMVSLTGEQKKLHGPMQRIEYTHEGMHAVRLDPLLLTSVVKNLLSNAIKFSPADGVIYLRTISTDNGVRLQVRDNGIGIPLEEQKHLGERFFRASNAGNYQGTGLGLHIVYRYVHLMNGSVNCQSRPGAGTEMNVDFINKTAPHEENTPD